MRGGAEPAAHNLKVGAGRAAHCALLLPRRPLEFQNMEFPQELCQAELAALPGSRSGIYRVGGAAVQAPHPHPLRGAADPAATCSFATPALSSRSLSSRRASGPRRPLPTRPRSQRLAARRPPRGPSRVGPRGLCATGAGCARGSASSSSLGRGPRGRGSPRWRQRRRGSGPAGGGRARPQPAEVVFCFEAGVGDGHHLVNEKFPVRKTQLAEFLSCP